jgi:hypothetical protein
MIKAAVIAAYLIKSSGLEYAAAADGQLNKAGQRIGLGASMTTDAVRELR